MSDWRDDEPTIVFETNEAAIEQSVDARSQKQAVFPVEPLFVRRVPPRLAVACNQVNRILDASDSAF